MRQVGARSYDFDLDTGIATFFPEADNALDLTAIETAVEQAGFELLWLELDLVGVVSPGSDSTGAELLALTVHSTQQRFLLYPGASEEERTGYARLQELLSQPLTSVRIRGRAHTHPGGSPALTVREFQMM